jgi:hypothetical protein
VVTWASRLQFGEVLDGVVRDAEPCRVAYGICHPTQREVTLEVETGSAPAATLEPKLVEILDRDPEELRSTWVEIRALPEMELVTAIEVLSPFNKSGPGRQVYLDKRDELHD